MVSLKDLKTLCQELLFSNAHINNLPIILSALSPSSPPDIAQEALISLHSFFLPLLPEIPSSSLSKQPRAEEDPEAFYLSWLHTKFHEFVNLLIEIVISHTSVELIKHAAVDSIMEFVKQDKEERFNSAIYHKFLQSIEL
ncbi:hypothetical protein KSP40_PGU006792 [Platanthera guangdongensis]|uniref:Uncharacterized protein n=1 Tax=Platanthera guangdongensis TaxID=2320717 RepID=A0ABR2LMI9_9ASPA